MTDTPINPTPQDRILLIINDNVIRGSMRWQNYGFILFKQHQLEPTELRHDFPAMEFYTDWEKHRYGPYSSALEEDLRKCFESKTIGQTNLSTLRGSKMDAYSLTIKGRLRWRSLFGTMEAVEKINKKVKQMQEISYYSLIRKAYNTYLEYAKTTTNNNRL